jgi:hypothetical protein
MDSYVEQLRADGVNVEDFVEMVWTYDIDNGDVLVLIRVGTM